MEYLFFKCISVFLWYIPIDGHVDCFKLLLFMDILVVLDFTSTSSTKVNILVYLFWDNLSTILHSYFIGYGTLSQNACVLKCFIDMAKNF